jgi:hypothetical protein
VFHTPELLEMMYSNLGMVGLLQGMQINKFAVQVVNGSPSLQRKLSLQPFRGTTYTSPFDAPNSAVLLTIAPSTETDPDFPDDEDEEDEQHLCKIQDTIEVDVIFRAVYGDQQPDVGCRCQSILLVNPPIFELEVSTRCCQRNHMASPRA